MKNQEFINKYKTKILETENLILRPLKASDAKDIFECMQDKVYSRHICVIPWPYTMSDAERFIKDARKNLKKSTPTLVFGLWHKKDKKLIGTEALNKINFRHKNCESGSWLSKKYWGSGLMAEARLEVFKLAFNDLKMHKIFSRVLADNIRSQKHIAKFGFKQQGYYRDELIIDSKFKSAYYYELLDKEFNYNKLKKKLLKNNESKTKR